MERRATWVRICHSWEEEAAADREYWARYSGDEKVAMIAGMVDEWENREMKIADGPSRNDYGEFFEALNRHGVRFLVVGAYAFAFHVKPRYTKDVDVLVEMSQTNAEGILRALADFGFGSLNISPADFREPGRITQLGYEPKRIDILTTIQGVTFAEAWERREAGMLAGEPVHYLSKADLIRSKEAAGRSQDLTDLESLR